MTGTAKEPREVTRTFRVLSVVTALLTLAGTAVTLSAIVIVWLPGDLPKKVFAEDVAVHRFHASMISIVTWVLFVAILSQLRRPQNKIATMILAVAVILITLPSDLLSPRFDPLELVVLALLMAMLWTHPGRINLRWRPFHMILLASLAVGSIPWLTYARNEVVKQLNGVSTDRHAELGHYAYMASVTLIILTAIFLGATSLRGRRMAMGLGVGAAMAFGILSILASNQQGSVGAGWGIAMIAWAAVLGFATFLPIKPRQNSGAKSAAPRSSPTRG